MSNRQGNSSAILPIANAIISKSHKNTGDSMLITYHTAPIAIAFVERKKCAITYRKCAIMEIIPLLSIGVNVLLQYTM